MKFLKNALLATLLAAGVTVAAHAQAPTVNVPTKSVEKPIAIKLGVYLPTDGDVKDAVGSSWFAIGGTYDFGKTKTEMPLVYSAYVDATFASKKRDGVKGEVSIIGVGPSARYYFTPVGGPVRAYAGLGVGVYFLHAKASADGESGSKNKTGVGGKVFAGAEFGSGFLGEVSYNFPGKIEGTKTDGIGISVGYRF